MSEEKEIFIERVDHSVRHVDTADSKVYLITWNAVSQVTLRMWVWKARRSLTRSHGTRSVGLDVCVSLSTWITGLTQSPSKVFTWGVGSSNWRLLNLYIDTYKHRLSRRRLFSREAQLAWSVLNTKRLALTFSLSSSLKHNEQPFQYAPCIYTTFCLHSTEDTHMSLHRPSALPASHSHGWVWCSYCDVFRKQSPSKEQSVDHHPTFFFFY